MTSSFLLGFSRSVVERLRERSWVEVREGGSEEVAFFVARRLEQAREGSSLISSLEAALLACPEVEELYADLDDLKDLVDGLG